MQASASPASAPEEWLARYPLLGPSDLQHIDRLGLPVNTTGLFAVAADGRIDCTARGSQFLAAFSEHYGLRVDLAQLTYPTLLELLLAVTSELRYRNALRIHSDLLANRLHGPELEWARHSALAP